MSTELKKNENKNDGEPRPVSYGRQPRQPPRTVYCTVRRVAIAEEPKETAIRTVRYCCTVLDVPRTEPRGLPFITYSSRCSRSQCRASPSLRLVAVRHVRPCYHDLQTLVGFGRTLQN
jgi:hypothetical protein